MPSLIATSGSGIPNRLIRQCGFEPIALCPTTDAPAAQGVCAVAQGVVDTLQRDASRFAGAVMTTRCDQLRRVVESHATSFQVPLLMMNPPTTIGTPASNKQQHDEHARLEAFLASLPHHDVSNDSGQNPEECSAKDSALAFPSFRPSQPRQSAIRARLGLLTCTVTTADAPVLDLLESLGLSIVLNCSGHAIPEDAPSIAQRPNSPFYSWIASESERASLDGWVLLCQPWCDIYRAEAARLKTEVPLPWLVLETGGSPALASLRTRAEAFLEMIVGRCAGESIAK